MYHTLVILHILFWFDRFFCERGGAGNCGRVRYAHAKNPGDFENGHEYFKDAMQRQRDINYVDMLSHTEVEFLISIECDWKKERLFTY